MDPIPVGAVDMSTPTTHGVSGIPITALHTGEGVRGWAMGMGNDHLGEPVLLQLGGHRLHHVGGAQHARLDAVHLMGEGGGNGGDAEGAWRRWQYPSIPGSRCGVHEFFWLVCIEHSQHLTSYGRRGKETLQSAALIHHTQANRAGWKTNCGTMFG